jgi:hypothetical protein
VGRFAAERCRRSTSGRQASNGSVDSQAGLSWGQLKSPYVEGPAGERGDGGNRFIFAGAGIAVSDGDRWRRGESERDRSNISKSATDDVSESTEGQTI